MPSHTNTSGFTLIEILVTISLLTGSYFVLSSTEHFMSSYLLKLERAVSALIELSNQHELSVALLEWGDQ